MKICYFLIWQLLFLVLTSCDNNPRIEKSYYEDGALKSEVEMVGDERHGEYRKYFRNGKLLMVAEYRNGKPHGWQHSYYQNGQKEYESKFIEGTPVGLSIAFYANGDTMSFYDKGRALRFFANGKIEQIICSQNEDLNSIRSIRFTSDGKMIKKEEPLYCLTKRDSLLLDEQYPQWKTSKVVKGATE